MIDPIKLVAQLQVALVNANASTPCPLYADAIEAAERYLKAPPQASQRKLVRYCYECGHIGEVSKGKRDCCPDGSHAVMVPKDVAEQARIGFKQQATSQGALTDAQIDAITDARHEAVGDDDIAETCRVFSNKDIRHIVREALALSSITKPSWTFTGKPEDVPSDAFPNQTLCANCGHRWGVHMGARCPEGKTTFQSKEPKHV